jgi:hypothetical protein
MRRAQRGASGREQRGKPLPVTGAEAAGRRPGTSSAGFNSINQINTIQHRI